MRRRKFKYVHGRHKTGRNKLLVTGLVVLLLAAVLIPWQSNVKNQYHRASDKVKRALLGDEAVNNETFVRLPDGPAPSISSLNDAIHAYGVSVGDSMAGMDVVGLDKQLNDIAGLHATWLQFDIPWQRIQPKDSNHYNWTAIDKIVRVAGSHRIKMVATLTGTPAWARLPGCDSSACAPADSNQFAEFAAQAAAHYSGMGVQIWEIWHEPNVANSWKPRANAAAYTKLLQASYSAIKVANPQALVLTGGTAPRTTYGGNIDQLDFLTDIYKAGGKGFFDAVATHPFTYPLVPSHSSQQAWSRLSQTGYSMRGIMAANKDEAKKIWLTAYGAPTAGTGPAANEENFNTVSATHVDESLQATMLIKAADLYQKYDWVGPLFWQSYKDTSNNSFGLLKQDGTPKPIKEVFRRIAGGATNP